MLQHNVLLGIAALKDEMIAIRHQIHSNPELSFEEEQTSNLVASLLEQYGYQVTRGIAKTGVVGQLKNGDGPSIGLRADMDALPIHEATNLSYASQNHGKMHACGHDGHTATLLTAARYLAENRDLFKGTINVIFQPAEEGYAGAEKMVQEGLFEKFPCDAIFGFHNWPGFEAGHFGFHAGPSMASADTVKITIEGKGGHGAMPHLSVDPVVVASSIVMALQTIVARNVNPLETTIITAGTIHAGSASNIIPNEAHMELTVRNLNPDVQDIVEQRIKDTVEYQAKSYGAIAKAEYIRDYPLLINSEKETAFAEKVGREFLGDDYIINDFKPITASEDFAFMLQKVPGCYVFVGNGLDGAQGCSLHNAHYDFNDEILPVVASYWVKLVEAYLKP